jgi:predicted TPR repeat methyltransferase
MALADRRRPLLFLPVCEPTSRMVKPLLNPNVFVSGVADGVVAYDSATDQLHNLNALAALILEFCDGVRSVGEIAAAVRPFVPDDRDSIVSQWIDDAIQAGLLIADADAVQNADTHLLSAPELVELANRLREHGKVQTAFICQQRAAELTPDDAQALCVLGELAHILGRRDEARQAYERYLALRPDDAEVAHLLTALRDDEIPERVPDQCIVQLYERFSSFYDENVYEDLGSEVPGRLARMVEQSLGNSRGLRVLDLGCGTGVSGKHVRACAEKLVGVDLSPDMVARARQLDMYDRLDVAEITDWLRRCDERFDVIVASDSFIYFGNLAQVVVPAVARLSPSGTIAFSVESGDESPYRLADSGRYVHHIDHVRAVAADTGLAVVQIEEAFQRLEYGEEVYGLYVVLRRE